jgi:hypothetical protein
MTKKAVLALVISSLAVLAVVSPAVAGGKKSHTDRRGGYSYDYSDSINTYGDSRSKYGSASVYRDPNLDKQTQAGPFDHGYFYNSGIGSSHGGDSPYMH